MAQKGLYIELRKKFQGTEFCDFYELAAKVSEYEELLREENQRRKNTMGIYFHEVSNAEVVVVDLVVTSSCVCPLWKRKPQKPGRSFKDPIPKISTPLKFQKQSRSLTSS